MNKSRILRGYIHAWISRGLKLILVLSHKEENNTCNQANGKCKNKSFKSCTKWLAFAYYEDGDYYFSNNGDLVEEFDAPNIIIDLMLDEIRKSISKFGCVLNVSNIVKKIDLNNIEEDYNQFLLAVKAVDNLYKNL